ncbi:hypothetical protein HOK51_10205 [Candidatus Woesearchaeota archaeon]|jgi:His-Xaa-Ser system protein HxsD|nr:hypothetical protein [Candidatus Woesearchaeota archaeon]MBT6520197.1 hypothetical protein [Candidatus Woesearchaeota archaeon]MBT7367865.1 hypothetical protein [Candidatus Woesearchaeota archaeon]
METNEQIEYSQNTAVLKLNPIIYPIGILYSAAYIMIDKAFIMFDGDPDKEIIVKIESKKSDDDINQIVQEFNDEILTYGVYNIQSEKNKDLREIIMKRVLITNEVIECMKELKQEFVMNNISKEDKEQEIFKPWEENEENKQQE